MTRNYFKLDIGENEFKKLVEKACLETDKRDYLHQLLEFSTMPFMVNIIRKKDSTIFSDYVMTNQRNPDVVDHIINLGYIPSKDYMISCCLDGDESIVEVLVNLKVLNNDTFTFDKKNYVIANKSENVAKILLKNGIINEHIFEISKKVRSAMQNC